MFTAQKLAIKMKAFKTELDETLSKAQIEHFVVNYEVNSSVR